MTKTSTVMSASFNTVPGLKKIQGAATQIGSTKNSQMSHVTSAYGKNSTSTKASSGQFGSTGTSVPSSSIKLRNSNNVQSS